jgi:hypothetical protein
VRGGVRLSRFPTSPRLLANKLGIRLRTLTFLAHKLKESSGTFYTEHRIPKGNSGKVRIVYSVSPTLKRVQHRLRELLEEVMPSTGMSYAYEKGRSVGSTSLRLHSAPLLISIDIKSHFTAVTMWQVSKTLEHGGATPEVAFLIARLACITLGKRSFLPQGSVMSPLVSNRVCEHLLDGRLAVEFPQAKITRYSDNIFLAFPNPEVSGKEVIAALRAIIAEATGWKCHKARIMPYYVQQRGLGLVLNQKANMPAEKYLALKATLYNLAHKATEEQVSRARATYGAEDDSPGELLGRLRGKLDYWQQFLNTERYEKLNKLWQTAARTLCSDAQ